MKERVRAVLIDENGSALVIKRSKPRKAPYWVLPGGGVEDSDLDNESALHRELREELDAEAAIMGLLWTVESNDERQYFYLARLRRCAFEQRTGPEFSDSGRGSYEPEFVPVTVVALGAIDLKPVAFTDYLIGALRAGVDLFSLVKRPRHPHTSALPLSLAVPECAQDMNAP